VPWAHLSGVCSASGVAVLGGPPMTDEQRRQARLARFARGKPSTLGMTGGSLLYITYIYLYHSTKSARLYAS
jgi:hypothetical protein